jgi:hypothetical protein
MNCAGDTYIGLSVSTAVTQTSMCNVTDFVLSSSALSARNNRIVLLKTVGNVRVGGVSVKKKVQYSGNELKSLTD